MCCALRIVVLEVAIGFGIMAGLLRRAAIAAPLGSQSLTCRHKVTAIEVLNKRDNVTTPLASTAIPDLLTEVNPESVGTAAYRAWPTTLDPTAQFDAASRDFVFDADGASARDPFALVRGVALSTVAKQTRPRLSWRASSEILPGPRRASAPRAFCCELRLSAVMSRSAPVSTETALGP